VRHCRRRKHERVFRWSERTVGLRGQLPPDAVEAIDAVGIELSGDADVESVVAALHSRGLGFMICIAGLMVIKDVPLAEAKWLVHGSRSLAAGRDDRETAWSAMHDEVLNMPDVSLADGDELG
jgi:hypothetical protein